MLSTWTKGSIIRATENRTNFSEGTAVVLKENKELAEFFDYASVVVVDLVTKDVVILSYRQIGKWVLITEKVQERGLEEVAADSIWDEYVKARLDNWGTLTSAVNAA